MQNSLHQNALKADFHSVEFFEQTEVYTRFVMSNILFKFKVIFSFTNDRLPVRSENSSEWNSAFGSDGCQSARFSKQGDFTLLKDIQTQIPIQLFNHKATSSALGHTSSHLIGLHAECEVTLNFRAYLLQATNFSFTTGTCDMIFQRDLERAGNTEVLVWKGK